MKNFLEVTGYKTGDKFLIAVDKIIAIEPAPHCTYITVNVGRGTKVSGFCVSDGYEKIKCMLTDIFGGDL